MKILYVGDIHGEFGKLNSLINKKKPDILIVCGDVAYYWGVEDNTGKIKPGKTKVYLVPGNHEHIWKAEKEVGRRNTHPIEIEPNIFYCPIGSCILVHNKRILFVGGADSYDKSARTIGIDWFPEELLNQADLDYILNMHQRVDIIVSHTCPDIFDMNVPLTFNDPSRKILTILYEKFHPEEWYFGHFHLFKRRQAGSTRWTCLDRIDGQERHFVEAHILGGDND